jgi:hypothetical protein
MSPTIFVDDEVFLALGERARPFIDTEPNHVIRRLLDLDVSGPTPESVVQLTTKSSAPVAAATAARPKRSRSRPAAAPSAPTRRKRARKGSLLDESAYWIPILRALDEHGGRLAASEVIERVGELVDDQLKPMDREKLETGGVRWHTRVQFARLRMKEQGFLNQDSPRGLWEISELGRKRLKEETSTAA